MSTYNQEIEDYSQDNRTTVPTQIKENSNLKRIYKDKLNDCTMELNDIEDECSRNKKSCRIDTASYNCDSYNKEKINYKNDYSSNRKSSPKIKRIKSNSSQSSNSSSCSSSSGIGSSNGIIQNVHNSNSTCQNQFNMKNIYFEEKNEKSNSNSFSTIEKTLVNDIMNKENDLSNSSEHENSPNTMDGKNDDFTSEYESEQETEIDVSINETDLATNERLKLKNNSINRMKKISRKKQSRKSSRISNIFNKTEEGTISNLLKTMNEILISQSILTRKVDQIKDNFFVFNKRLSGLLYLCKHFLSFDKHTNFTLF